MYLQKRNFKKFGNQTAEYNGSIYHSIKEANYARQLDLRVRAKNDSLKEWRRQVPVHLYVNGAKICTYTIDFVEIDDLGNEMYTEVKGFETPEWRLKWKLFDALYPDLEKQVIK